MVSVRPSPRHENGKFVPAVPVPDPRKPDEFTAFDSFKTLRTLTRNPLETFAAEHYKQPISQYRLLGSNFTVINDPKMIRYCFVENADNYELQAIRQRVLKPMLREGLVTAEGESWKRARRSLTPLFTPKHVRSFAKGMVETSEREMPGLLVHEDIVSFSDVMSSFTYLVLSDALFSGQISESRKDVLDNVSTALKYMGRPDPLDILDMPDWMPRLTKLKGKKAVRNLRHMVFDAWQVRADMQRNNEPLPEDFLTLLMECTDEDGSSLNADEIEDHLITFIGAGHETTARALAWFFYLLDNDHEVRQKLEAEVDDLDMSRPPESWGDQLPWMKACLEETLRLFPSVPLISRAAIISDEFEGVKIPAGAVTMVNLWQLHRHETLWDAPEVYDPMRFYGEARKSVNLYQYLPFGLGPRVCIGQRFAMQEAIIIIALLAKSYRFEYVGDEPPWPKMRVTIQAENGMPMKVIKR